MSQSIGTVHHLPCSPVMNEKREIVTTKIAFDVSPKITGSSLYDCLFSGPCITEYLFLILLRFHVDRIAMFADAEKVFLQMTVLKNIGALF